MQYLGPGLDLTAHTSLSPIRRGFAPSFVNYKKGCTRLAAASDKSLPVACPCSVVHSGYSGFFPPWYKWNIIIPPLIERGQYCNHLVSPSVRLSVRSHFRNRYLGFYWKKWLHIYFLFTVQLTNGRVGVFLARRSVQHLVLLEIYSSYVMYFIKTKVDHPQA
jgi:hypothetical protein